MQYVITIDKYLKTTKDYIDEVRDYITNLSNRLSHGTYCKTICSRFYGVRSEMYVYYKPEIAEQQKNDLIRLAISKEEKLAQRKTLTGKEIKDCLRFYDIVTQKDGTFDFTLNYDKLENLSQNCGYSCIISNTSCNNEKILNIYYSKDVIEKGFEERKNYIDMKTLHTHAMIKRLMASSFVHFLL
jgi:transposase